MNDQTATNRNSPDKFIETRGCSPLFKLYICVFPEKYSNLQTPASNLHNLQMPVQTPANDYMFMQVPIQTPASEVTASYAQ